MGRGGLVSVADTHERFEGPIHVVGPAREGWAFFCACGFRSPLYPQISDATEAMQQHRQNPPAETKHRLLARKPRQPHWPGWPHDRRHPPVSLAGP